MACVKWRGEAETTCTEIPSKVFNSKKYAGFALLIQGINRHLVRDHPPVIPTFHEMQLKTGSI
jgi:hypothetical protein